jgi:hypothetical protein
MQAEYTVNVVMHRGAEGVLINPPHPTVLGAGDTLLVIAQMKCPIALESANQPRAATSAPGPDPRVGAGDLENANGR